MYFSEVSVGVLHYFSLFCGRGKGITIAFFPLRCCAETQSCFHVFFLSNQTGFWSIVVKMRGEEGRFPNLLATSSLKVSLSVSSRDGVTFNFYFVRDLSIHPSLRDQGDGAQSLFSKKSVLFKFIILICIRKSMFFVFELSSLVPCPKHTQRRKNTTPSFFTSQIVSLYSVKEI